MASVILALVKLGIGGFSMGAATALYSATCFAQGKYGNGNPYPVNLRAVIGLSGWLPGSSSRVEYDKSIVQESTEQVEVQESFFLLLQWFNLKNIVYIYCDFFFRS